MGKGIAGNIGMLLYTIMLWACLVGCPFRLGNKNFPGLAVSVKGRTNVLCVREASDLPPRGTVHPGWWFSSDICLIKNRTLLLELRIVQSLYSTAPV